MFLVNVPVVIIGLMAGRLFDEGLAFLEAGLRLQLNGSVWRPTDWLLAVAERVVKHWSWRLAAGG